MIPENVYWRTSLTEVRLHLPKIKRNKLMKESYGTLSETINGLKKEGYTHDFNIRTDYIICSQTNVKLSPDDFEIDKVYRFEGVSNPDDESVLYAISSTKPGVKGVLVNGYGISADEATDRLITKLRTHSGTLL